MQTIREEQIFSAADAAYDSAPYESEQETLAFQNGFYKGVEWIIDNPDWHKWPEEKPTIGNKTDFVIWFTVQLKDGSVFPAIYEPMKLYRGNIGHKEGWRCLISGRVYDLDEAVAWMEMPKPIHID